MSKNRSLARRRAITATVLLATVGAACTSGIASPVPTPTAVPPTPSASSSPRGPATEVVVDLLDVRVDSVEGEVLPRDLREPAHAVAAMMATYYSIAFVDPSRWEGGEFTPLFRLFAADVREQAHRDLERLSLGRAALELDGVRPTHARLALRFLTDAGGHPVAVVADMSFDGVARAGDLRAQVTHESEFVLRHLSGGWRIVSYDVRGHGPAVGELGGAREASFAPGVPSIGPLFVLVIGSDARPGQPVERSRADSLHIVGVNPSLGRASILGIPRDSWVSIPGVGTNRINAALFYGGPELVVQTVEHLSGIPIDAYVLTGFQGFQDIVGAVGGIDIHIPSPINDPYAHARFEAGPEHLTGREALAYARARHALPNGDFGRTLNQGRLLIAALATLRDRLASGAGVLLPWIVAGAQNLRTDLSLADLFDLILAAPAFDPRQVRNEVVTGRIGNAGGRSVVLLDSNAHARFLDLARDGVLDG